MKDAAPYPIYLDHCGTTPLNSNVLKVLTSSDTYSFYGNPSASHHAVGMLTLERLENARAGFSKIFGVTPNQVIFTSGASEANNLVIQGFCLRFRGRGCRILYSAIEHKSALDTAARMADMEGVTPLQLPVSHIGLVDLEVLENYLLDNPKNLPTLVVVMHTNNEIPARQPVETITALCLKYKAYFHMDAVQGYVREPINLSQTPYGSVVISGHKIYGPKGFGALILSSNPTSPPIIPLLAGGEQEQGLRPGTPNTVSVMAAEVAVSEHETLREKLRLHMSQCDDVFLEEATKHLPGFHLTVPFTKTAPGILNFYIDGVDAPSLLLKIPSVCINRGASCIGAGGEKFSHVPKALGLPVEIQANVLRASFGFGCRKEDLLDAVLRIKAAAYSGLTGQK